MCVAVCCDVYGVSCLSVEVNSVVCVGRQECVCMCACVVVSCCVVLRCVVSWFVVHVVLCCVALCCRVSCCVHIVVCRAVLLLPYRICVTLEHVKCSKAWS